MRSCCRRCWGLQTRRTGSHAEALANQPTAQLHAPPRHACARLEAARGPACGPAAAPPRTVPARHGQQAALGVLDALIHLQRHLGCGHLLHASVQHMRPVCLGACGDLLPALQAEQRKGHVRVTEPAQAAPFAGETWGRSSPCPRPPPVPQNPCPPACSGGAMPCLVGGVGGCPWRNSRHVNCRPALPPAHPEDVVCCVQPQLPQLPDVVHRLGRQLQEGWGVVTGVRGHCREATCWRAAAAVNFRWRVAAAAAVASCGRSAPGAPPCLGVEGKVDVAVLRLPHHALPAQLGERGIVDVLRVARPANVYIRGGGGGRRRQQAGGQQQRRRRFASDHAALCCRG